MTAGKDSSLDRETDFGFENEEEDDELDEHAAHEAAESFLALLDNADAVEANSAIEKTRSPESSSARSEMAQTEAVPELVLNFTAAEAEPAKMLTEQAELKAQTPQSTLLDGELPGKSTPIEPFVSETQAALGPVIDIFDQPWRLPSFNSPLESYEVQDARRAEKEGDLNKAVELWTKEQDRLKKGYGNDVALYDSSKELARLYEKMPDKSAEARKQYELSLEIIKKQSEWNDRWDTKLDPTVTALHLKIAKTYEAEGKFDKALDQQKLALKVATKGESDYNWAQKKDSLKIDCRSAMAETLMKMGKPEEAIKEYQQNIKLLKLQSGYSEYSASPQDKAIIATQIKTAEALVKAGKQDDAVKVYEQNMAMIKRQRDYSDYSPSKWDRDVVQTQRAIAKIRTEQGRYDDAFKALAENQKLLDSKYHMTSYGDKTAVGAFTQYHADMANLYAKRAESKKDDPAARNADYDKAVQERQKELDIYKRYQSWDSRDKTQDPYVFAAQRDIAKFLQASGKEEEALKMQEKQIPILERAGAKPAEVAACIQKIADGYEKLGKLDTAISMHKQACYKLEGKEGYQEARERLAATYAKAGKDIRTEEAREDKEAFDRCDEVEKFPYIFNKLPNKLAIETSAEGTKLSTDNLPKLFEAAPGLMLDRVLKEAFAAGQTPEQAEKTAAAIMQALRDTTDISIKGNKIEFTRKNASEIPFSQELPIGRVNAIRMGEKVSFEIETDPKDPSKIRIKNIQGITALGDRPSLIPLDKSRVPMSIGIRSLEVYEQDNGGSRDRMLSVNGLPGTKLEGNVSDSDSAKYRASMKLMTDTIGKLGKGDMNGLLEMLGAGGIPQPLKDLFTDVTAIKKDGGNIHMDLKKPHEMTAGDFTGGAQVDGNPRVAISSSVDFYMSPSSKYSVDISSIKGITFKSDGWMGRLLGSDGHVAANLDHIYIGGQSGGERSFGIGFDRLLRDLSVRLTAQGAPAASSTIRITVDNPIDSKKKETIRIKVDRNGEFSASNIAEEGFSFLLESVRRGLLD